MRILVAGAGYVGRALASVLVERDGSQVFALRRRLVAPEGGVVPIACDLATDSAIDDKLPDDLDAVVYTVGADEHTPDAYERAYVRSLERLLEALAAKCRTPRRFVFVSSTAVYGQNAGEWVDETSPTEPTEFSGRTLLRAEALALGFAAESIVLRFGGIYGPARTRFVDSVRDGTIRLSSSLEHTNRIHVADCALVLRHLLQIASPARAYVGVDDEPAERSTVAAWMATTLGVALPHRDASSDAAVRGKRCSNARLRASGYAFRFPTFREGYADVIASR